MVYLKKLLLVLVVATTVSARQEVNQAQNSLIESFFGQDGENPTGETLRLMKDVFENRIRGALRLGFGCGLCKDGLNVVFNEIKSGKTDDEIAHDMVGFCNIIEPEAVCEGVISRVKDAGLMFILRQTNFTVEDLCGIYEEGSCMTQETIDKLRWTVPMPQTPKPPIVNVQPPPEGAPTLKILHLTDTHMDEFYSNEALATCKDPLCCRVSSGNVTSPDEEAWFWGDYRNCDSRPITLVSMLNFIKLNHQIDYIIFTGDAPSHAIWEQTKDEIVSASLLTTAMIRSTFPSVPFFPAVGNHEAMPVNSFPPPELNATWSHDWFYEPISNDWVQSLPEETRQTIRKGGYYSTVVKPGLRLISMNDIYGHQENWWGLLNYPDPGNMLAWFAEELDKAERNNEKVHLIAHVPTINLMRPYYENWHRIINRYESTIVAIFNGHTHTDQFELNFDSEDQSRPISVGFIAPSVTPYTDLNPAYRIYTIDGDRPNSTWAVLNHETYFMNLTEAQEQGAEEPKWKLVYSAKEAYNMTGMQPKDWLSVAKKLNQSDDLLQLYYSFYHRFSPYFPSCDEECKVNLIDSIFITPPTSN